MPASGVIASDIDTGLDRPLTPAEEARLSTWIRDAETLIGLRHIANLDPDAFQMVVRLAVEKRWDSRGSAGDVTSTTTQVDDAMVTKRFGEWNGKSGSPMWFDPIWWEWLTPTVESAALSTRPRFEPDRQCWDGLL